MLSRFVTTSFFSVAVDAYRWSFCGFLATVCKTVRPMLSDRCPVCLDVTLVYCGQTVRWIQMKLDLEVGLGPGHVVLDGDPALPPPKGTAPIYGPCLLCYMGTPQKGAQQSPPPIFGPFLQRAQCSHCKRCISYSNSVRLSVRLSHAGIVSKRRHVARCSLHRWIAKYV